MELLAKHGSVIARVLDHCGCIPLAAATDARQGALKLILPVHLMNLRILQIRELNRSLDVLPYVEMSPAGMLAPPSDERLVVGSLVANFPINLRYVVINPTLFYPFQHVGIKVVIVLQAVCDASCRVVLLITIDAEGSHTELHPGFHCMQALVELLHKEVHVLTAPVATVHAITIHSIRVVIGNGHSCHGVWIEIVVDMKAVDIVAPYNVASYAAYPLAVLGTSGVEENKPVVIEEKLRVTLIGMIDGQESGALRLRTIRIDPCMKLHATGVTLLNHPLQRVPERIGRRALLTSQIAAPRLQFAGIQCITLHSYLKEDRIDAILLELVELIG